MSDIFLQKLLLAVQLLNNWWKSAIEQPIFVNFQTP